MDVQAKLQQLEQLAGFSLPAAYRTRVSMSRGLGETVNEDEGSAREFLLYGLERAISSLPAWREGWGRPARNAVPIGSILAGGSKVGIDRHGRVLDLHGPPESWRILSDSFDAFLDRVERDGIEWIIGGG